MAIEQTFLRNNMYFDERECSTFAKEETERFLSDGRKVHC